MNGLSYLFKAFQLMAAVSEWSQKALEDGKVTLKEAVDLAEKVCPILGIPLEIRMPGSDTSEPEKAETDLEEKSEEPKKSWEQ